MANAGCINAIGFDGTYLRTLDTLDSANIGVGVAYTAPNPLDDKRFDYIKYTDKCGNTCCLSGENEILIYATQGVIKNLTLTNDDTNEQVIVKWTDLFGSNRAKTIVRYKTTGYPTSPTDGTLAVESTVKNQYATNGFNVSGLEDGTTYYFSVFAVDSLGTMINVQSDSVITNFFYGKYQKVEYIQGTGTQYIKTNIVPSNSKGVYIKVSSQDIQTDLLIFGSRKTIDTRFWCGNSGGKFYLGRNSNDYSNTISTNTAYEIKINYLNDRKKQVDNTVVASNIGTLDSSNNVPVYIMAGNDNYSTDITKYCPSKIKLYFCKISDGSSITHDFVPVYRKSDSVIGLLDIINKVFYTNQGSGTFTKGPNV